jgi:hypothetical protein
MTPSAPVPRWLIAVAAALGLFFGLSTIAHAQPGHVAVFDNGLYIDNTETNFGAEGPNTIASLQSFGETVTPFTGITAADFTAALAGQDSLVIPEQENAEVPDGEMVRGDQPPEPCLSIDMADDAIAAVRNFVASGGQLVVMAYGEDECSTEFVDDVFNFSLAPGAESELAVRGLEGGPVIYSKTPNANGTEFQDGPATIPANNATGTVDESTLPAVGGIPIYSDGAGSSAVADIPYLDGSITLLGWDWFDSTPPDPNPLSVPELSTRRAQTRGESGGQDFGWQDVLRRSVDLPVLTVNDVSLNEGNSGTTPFNFTVTSSENHSENIHATDATADGTAKAGSDYTAAGGAFTMPRFTNSGGITVNVTGDTAVEPNETFALNLTGPFPAVVGKNGTGTIVNDDFAAPKVGVAGVRRACTSSTVHVRFTINSGAGIKSVRVTLDGKKVTSTTKSRFTVKVNTSKLTAGRHTLTAVAVDKNGKKTTVHKTIARCAAAKPRRQAAPRFTG